MIVAFAISAAAVAQGRSSRQVWPETVWTWSSKCDGTDKLGMTVHLDHKVIYRGVLPICHGTRSGENGRVEFHFSGDHLFQREYRTRSTDSIEGDIWEADGEPDVLVLGVSFQTNRQVLLNTLHIARADKQASSELDKGLFITTYPASVR